MSTNKKFFIMFSLVSVLVICFATAIGFGDNAKSTKGGGRTIINSPQVYVPYSYPYPNYDDTYYRRALDQYQAQTESRLVQIENDFKAVGQDIDNLIKENNQTQTSSAQVLRKLNSIEQTLGNINGRLKKLEQTVNVQNLRIRKLMKESQAADSNQVVAEPNISAEPNSTQAQ
jgi:hypothetical protein